MSIYYSWSTKKNGEEFIWTVTKNISRATNNDSGGYLDTETVKTGSLSTRARARGAAQRWVKYYNSQPVEAVEQEAETEQEAATTAVFKKGSAYKFEQKGGHVKNAVCTNVTTCTATFNISEDQEVIKRMIWTDSDKNECVNYAIKPGCLEDECISSLNEVKYEVAEEVEPESIAVKEDDQEAQVDVTGTYSRYCPNVFLAKVTQECIGGQQVTLVTRYGKENEVIIFNEIYRKNEFIFYSFVRADGFDHQAWVVRKAEKFERWAESADKQSAEYYKKSNEHADFLRLAEPIKVGHHSEKWHRGAIKKAQDNTQKSFEFMSKADAHREKEEYWKKRENEINLSMPESVEYFEHKLEKATERHSLLKGNKALRSHSYSLTYANKDKKEAAKSLEIAIKLWA